MQSLNNSCFQTSLFSHQSSPNQTACESLKKSTDDQKDPDRPCFTKKEVRDIIFERNELKTNLFLVQEELRYYQRWVHCTVCVCVCVMSCYSSEKKLHILLNRGQFKCRCIDCALDVDLWVM